MCLICYPCDVYIPKSPECSLPYFFETPFQINSPSKFHGKYCHLVVYFRRAY